MKYAVYGIVRGTKYLGVFEAENEEQAIQAALGSDANSLSLCHQCADGFDLDDISCSEAVAEKE